MNADSIEANKALVRRYIDEIQNQHRLDALDSIFSAGFIDHANAFDGVFQGVDGLRRGYEVMLAAFPDFHATLHEQVGEGDRVVTRKTIRATHRGEFRGIPATDTRVGFEVIDIFRIEDGRIAECGFLFDEYRLMQQLGIMKEK